MARMLAGAILGLCLLLVVQPNQAAAQGGTVSGVVLNSRQAPIPGCTVYLVHTVVGRSSPYWTNPQGQFSFTSVPLRNDPYYLEIYWGKQLLYRKPVIIRGNVALAPIIL